MFKSYQIYKPTIISSISNLWTILELDDGFITSLLLISIKFLFKWETGSKKFRVRVKKRVLTGGFQLSRLLYQVLLDNW